MTNPSSSTALANEASLSSSPTKTIPNNDDNHLSEKKPAPSNNSDQPLPSGKEEIDNMHRNNNNNHHNNPNVQSFNMEDFPPGFGTSYSVNHSELTPVHTDLEAPGAPLDRNKYPVLIKHRKEKSRFLPCLPCIRSTCGRVACCICILLILIAIILAIVAVTIFKIPTVDYVGPQGNPQFVINQGNVTLGLDMVANIQVVNPNPIGFNFELIGITVKYTYITTKKREKG